MFNLNKGYVGHSRSVNSENAILNYEVPLSLIKKSLIEDFLYENEEYQSLEDVPVSVWKYLAKRSVPTSWHHTSNRFNKTNHYSLFSIAEDLLENKEYWIERYQVHLKYKKEISIKELKNLKLTVVTAEIWGGTRKYPKLLGHEKILCIIKGSFAYPVSESEKSRYNINANKNSIGIKYNIDEYYDLIKTHKEFKSMKRQVNKLAKILSKQK